MITRPGRFQILAIPFWILTVPGLVYRLGGLPVCDYLTNLFESEARDSDSEPFRELISYSCHDGGALCDQGKIHLHFFSME